MAEPMKTAKLKSSDGVQIVVSESAAMPSQTICQMFGADGAETTIPLTSTAAKDLAKAIGYCKQQFDAAQGTGVSSEEDLTNWEQQILDAGFVEYCFKMR